MLVDELRDNAPDDPAQLLRYLHTAGTIFLKRTGLEDYPVNDDTVKVAILQLAVHLWTHRGDTAETFPPGFKAIVNLYKVRFTA